MKAAVFYGKQDLRIIDIPVPEINDNEVLVKVMACGICGTDVHIYHGDEGAAPTPAGTVLGHEFSGIAVKVGANVKSIKEGDKVCVDPNFMCGKCDYCRNGIGHYCEAMTGYGTTVNGGFAQYCAVNEAVVYRVADHLTFEQAAMGEPVSCCIHGIDMCDIDVSSNVAVIGCGMIGLIMMQLAKLRGAAKLIAIEPVAEKRDQALKLGADMVIDPMSCDVKAELVNAGIKRLDVVIECVGKTATVSQAIDIAGNKSTVMLFGLTAPNDTVAVKPFEIFKKEVVIKASFINPYTIDRALRLIASGKIDVSSMVTRLAPIDALPEILENPALRRDGKVIISCQE